MKIEGSTILVTGASSGIGAALGPQLAERGATVGIVVSISAPIYRRITGRSRFSFSCRLMAVCTHSSNRRKGTSVT